MNKREIKLLTLKDLMDRAGEWFYIAGSNLQTANENFYEAQTVLRNISCKYYALKEKLENKNAKRKD